jgi:hypothetical protein
MYDEDRLLLIVLFAGALGALVHGLRSLSWYIGNRTAVMSWSAMYIMLPFLGAGLATIFYLVVRGGFFSPTSTVADTSPFGFAALAALIGMFTEPAVLKLRKVASTIFEPTEKGKDHVGPAPKVVDVTPKQGTTAGGDTVTLTGTDFSAAVKVTFGNLEAKVAASSNTSITVTTPPHPAGKVDVVIINDDDQQHVLKEGFEYVDPAAGGSGTGAGTANTAATGTTGAGGTTGTGAASGPTEATTATTTTTATALDEEKDVDKIDGCDIDIIDETPDEDLPMTEGGVA